MLHYVAVCCSVLQCVAVRCSVLQYAAVCCSVLQCVADALCRRSLSPSKPQMRDLYALFSSASMGTADRDSSEEEAETVERERGDGDGEEEAESADQERDFGLKSRMRILADGGGG